MKRHLLTVLGVLNCASEFLASRKASSPVSRVVELLLNLQEKLEEDFKDEEKLFKKYECWSRSVKDAKEATNAAATSRIDSLKAYVKDIEAGKIEFTTERVDLEKQIAELTQDLETAAALRSKEAKDYDAAKVELQQGISALGEAIDVLKGASPASLLTRERGAVRQLSAKWSLRKALEFSRGMLSESDSRFLQHLMSSDVPVYDWKKLNREATFKKTYVAQSGSIISVLSKLKNTFTENLLEVEAKETEAKSTYAALKTSKGTMLSTAQAALVALVEENGARGLSKAEAQEEISALEAQVEADTDFIASVQASYDTKRGEWDARKELRTKEISAISEAIAVLHSDEARDTFSKSFTSQGFSFIQQSQESQVSSSPHVVSRSRAKEFIRSLAKTYDDKRLLLLSNLAHAGGLEQVVTQIDTLVGILNAEEADDLAKKESCEADLANTTQTAKTISRAVDGLTDDITRAEEKISEIDGQVKEQEQIIVGLNSTLVQIANQREDEAKQFEEAKAIDSSALSVIDQAVMILQTLLQDLDATPAPAPVAFFAVSHLSASSEQKVDRPHRREEDVVGNEIPAARTRKGVSRLLQRERQGMGIARAKEVQPYDVQAGQAPPPPPATWTEPVYAGASGESAGILSILELVKEDVQKDIDMAQAAETTAIEAYDSQKADLDASIDAANGAIASYEEERSNLESDKVDKASEKDLKKAELGATMKEIESMRPGCDFVLVNFDNRAKKRHIEIDGLMQAKAVLQGASFAS